MGRLRRDGFLVEISFFFSPEGELLSCVDKKVTKEATPSLRSLRDFLHSGANIAVALTGILPCKAKSDVLSDFPQYRHLRSARQEGGIGADSRVFLFLVLKLGRLTLLAVGAVHGCSLRNNFFC